MSVSSPSDPQSSRPRAGDATEALDLGEWLANFWEGRYLILGCTLAFMAMGAFAALTSTPAYQTEAMLQVQGKRVGASDPAFSKMENLFAEPPEASAEIEILKSNKVLGGTVEALGLDLVVKPKLMPVVGAFFARGRADAPKLDIESFEVPAQWRGERFSVVALKDGEFQWNGPDGSVLGKGKPGETLRGFLAGIPLTLKVRDLTARPDQTFFFSKKPVNAALAELGLRFNAFEKGKQTNVIGLTLTDGSPKRGAEILNEIINRYIQHKVERKSGDASKTLAILQEKLPGLKAKLDASENKLNQFRSRSGSVDLGREADVSIQQSAALSAQISTLKQKKEEMLRTYRENSDVVTTLNQQIAKLQGELGQVNSKVRALPGTQQEVVRLSREVQVNTELYTAVLNNIQQLQVANAGEVGSVTIVDPATPNLTPLGLRPLMQVALYTFLGFLLGICLLLLKRALRSGIKDHRLIESKLGLPVIVTIPHSKAQEEHYRAISQRKDGSHLLASLTPDDLAMESLRSLRTVLHFSMKDAANNAIMITGPSPSIGKSFVSSNFSAVLAQTGARVLVVDGDLRRGNLHHYFGLKNRLGGLSEVLTGRTTWKEAIHQTELPGLDLISTGVIPPNPADLLMTAQFSDFIKEACAAYDFVIIDGAPLLPVTDSLIIGSKVGTVLLVAKYDQHPLDELRTCQSRLQSQNIPIGGCIFNDITPLGLGYAYQDYRYAYHYKYK
ncbi:MAG: polysaccharide biosynthesis tyrosine autokinase [Acidobacteria bacterium]|nr:polysaccharide biosynthesis tyrosine autokinase [Acidobacteriota bacterium]MBI3487722.1 polysaccharide biosynthesis tyrosine autokinase [Acidobacteriota bacterium]